MSSQNRRSSRPARLPRSRVGDGPVAGSVTSGRRPQAHDWPGNVRELQNTLTRAALFADGATIEAEDIELLSSRKDPGNAILGRPLGDGLEVKALVDDVRRHYLERALREARGRKREAGDLIGIGRQSVSDWMRQLEVAWPDAE